MKATRIEKIERVVQARIDGVYDDPDLLEFGCLSIDTDEDVETIIAYSGLSKEDEQKLRKKYL
jgi:hypothetical protein